MDSMKFITVCILICQLPKLGHGIEFDPFNYQLSGRAMAANQRLVVAIQNRSAPSFSAVQDYSNSLPTFCSFVVNLVGIRDLYAMMVAVPRRLTVPGNTNTFVFVGYSQSMTSTYLMVSTISFPTCTVTSSLPFYIVNTTYPEYSTLAVDPNGDLVFYVWDRKLYIQSIRSPMMTSVISGITFGPLIYFFPVSIELHQSWGILSGYQGQVSTSPSLQRLRPTLHLFNYSSCYTSIHSSCNRFLISWTLNYVTFWHVNQAPPMNFIEDPYNPLYDIAVSINDNRTIIVGIQSINTVYRLSYNSFGLTQLNSRTPSSEIQVGFGKSVGWLDDETMAVLHNTWAYHYSIWYSSQIELYPISASVSLSDNIAAYSSLPSVSRKLWSKFNNQIIDMIAVFRGDAIILMDRTGMIFIVRSSPVGQFAQIQDGITVSGSNIYLAPIIPCLSGSIKNKSSTGQDLFLGCELCPAGTFFPSGSPHTAIRCIPCNLSRSFCPYGAVQELPVTVLSSTDQLDAYPESPDNDVLEDVLLMNMFTMNFSSDCLMKQPMFWATSLIVLACLLLVFMGIWKLSGKFKHQRRLMKSIFKQTDLIGEGELWIGGVASFAILVICIFAFRFSSAFMNQYPIESAGESTFACDPKLFNAKFSTTLKSLATPVSDEDEVLFNMLNDQPFVLHVDFLSTIFTVQDLTVMQVAGLHQWTLPTTATNFNGILFTSTNLTSHNIVIQLKLATDATIGAFRIGLSGPSSRENNYYVQQLNFSQVFNFTNRIMTQDPEITMPLVRVINETQSLSNSDPSQFSGLWIPTFIYNYDQLFYTYDEYLRYHTRDHTILTITITEASYFISNVQEPIARLTELIFTNILFSTMCIELFALVFLFYKLAIHPIIQLCVRRCRCKKRISPGTKAGAGCPYCQPVDIDSLPAYRVPVQGSDAVKPQHAIQRQSKPNFDLISSTD